MSISHRVERVIMWSRVQALVMCVLVATVSGCSSDKGPSGPGGNDLALETDRAASDSIGTGGGAITATSSTGVTYTLTIPPGALMAPVKITLTPVARHENLPGSIEFAAGVAYAPEGLQLAQPARLTVTPVPAAPSGKRIAALSFEDDGDSLSLSPNGASGSTLTALVPHFSGTSFIYGTTADLQLIASAAPTTSIADQFYLNQLSALGAIFTQQFPAALPILQDWFANVVLPQLQGAGTDAELVLATQTYSFWHRLAEAYLTGTSTGGAFPLADAALPALATEEAQARQAVAPQLRNAIAGNNSRCLTQRNVQALLNVLFWQDWARFFAVDTPAEQLDRQGVISGLCGRVVADQVSLADPLPVGQGVSLDIVWGLLIGSSPPVLPGDFAVTVGGSGTVSVAPASGFSGPQPGGGAAQGFFTTVVTASGSSALISASACLIRPGTTTPIPDLCGSVDLDRGGGTGVADGAYDGTASLAFLIDPSNTTPFSDRWWVINAGTSTLQLRRGSINSPTRPTSCVPGSCFHSFTMNGTLFQNDIAPGITMSGSLSGNQLHIVIEDLRPSLCFLANQQNQTPCRYTFDGVLNSSP